MEYMCTSLDEIGCGERQTNTPYGDKPSEHQGWRNATGGSTQNYNVYEEFYGFTFVLHDNVTVIGTGRPRLQRWITGLHSQKSCHIVE